MVRIGGAIASLGPLVSGALLEEFWWGSVFVITLPLVGVALVMAIVFVPSHVNETSDPVDNLGGILSVVLVGASILAINFAPVPNEGRSWSVSPHRARGARVPSTSASAAHATRSTTWTSRVAALFWVAACAGIIVFGSLMAAMFVSQQYLQNVNGYLDARGRSGDPPAALVMVIVAPRSAKLVEARGARFTLLSGYVFLSGVPLDAARLERGSVATGRSRPPTSSSEPGSGSPARPRRTRSPAPCR